MVATINDLTYKKAPMVTGIDKAVNRQCRGEGGKRKFKTEFPFSKWIYSMRSFMYQYNWAWYHSKYQRGPSPSLVCCKQWSAEAGGPWKMGEFTWGEGRVFLFCSYRSVAGTKAQEEPWAEPSCGTLSGLASLFLHTLTHTRHLCPHGMSTHNQASCTIII